MAHAQLDVEGGYSKQRATRERETEREYILPLTNLTNQSVK
jgi:hypothetical protein